MEKLLLVFLAILFLAFSLALDFEHEAATQEESTERKGKIRECPSQIQLICNVLD